MSENQENQSYLSGHYMGSPKRGENSFINPKDEKMGQSASVKMFGAS